MPVYTIRELTEQGLQIPLPQDHNDTRSAASTANLSDASRPKNLRELTQAGLYPQEEAKPVIEPRGPIDETLSALGAGYAQTGAAIGGTMEMLGIPGGQKIRDEWQAIGELPSLQRPTYLQKDDSIRGSDWRWWVRNVGENLPNFVMMYGAGGAAGAGAKVAGLGIKAISRAAMAGGFGSSFTMEAGSQYAQAKAEMLQEGYNDEEIERVATLEGMVAGTANAIIEMIPMGNVFGKTPVAQSLLKRILKQGFLEGSTEVMQEGVNVFAEKIGHKPDQQWSDQVNRLLTSGIVGSVLGGGVGGPMGAAVHNRQTQQYNALADQLAVKEDIYAWKDAGIADEEIAARVESRIKKIREETEPQPDKKAPEQYALAPDQAEQKHPPQVFTLPEIDTREMVDFVLYGTGKYKPQSTPVSERVASARDKVMGAFGMRRRVQAEAQPQAKPAPGAPEGGMTTTGTEITDIGKAGQNEARVTDQAQTAARVQGEGLFDKALTELTEENAAQLEEARLLEAQRREAEEAQAAAREQQKLQSAIGAAQAEQDALKTKLAGDEARKQAIVDDVLKMTDRRLLTAAQTEAGWDIAPDGRGSYALTTPTGPVPVNLMQIREQLARVRLDAQEAKDRQLAADEAATRQMEEREAQRKAQKQEKEKLDFVRRFLATGTVNPGQRAYLEAHRDQLTDKEIQELDAMKEAEGAQPAAAAAPAPVQGVRSLGARPQAAPPAAPAIPKPTGPILEEVENPDAKPPEAPDTEKRTQALVASMLLDLENSSKGGQLETDQVTGETTRTTAGIPWLTAANKKGAKISQADALTVLEKVQAAKPLTARQEEIFSAIIAPAEQGGAGQFADALHWAEKGYLPQERGRIAVDDMVEGDQYVIDGEEYKVTDIDEDGNVTLKDGTIKKVKGGELLSVDFAKPSAEAEFNPDDLLEAPAAAPASSAVPQSTKTLGAKPKPAQASKDTGAGEIVESRASSQGKKTEAIGLPPAAEDQVPQEGKIPQGARSLGAKPKTAPEAGATSEGEEDREYYHGTAKRFNEYDPSRQGKGVGWNDQGKALYLTEDEPTGKMFANVARQNMYLYDKSLSPEESIESSGRVTGGEETGEVMKAKLEKGTKILDIETATIPKDKAIEILKKAGLEKRATMNGGTYVDTAAGDLKPNTPIKDVLRWLQYADKDINPTEFITKELGYDAARFKDERMKTWDYWRDEFGAFPKDIPYTVALYNHEKAIFDKASSPAPLPKPPEDSISGKVEAAGVNPAIPGPQGVRSLGARPTAVAATEDKATSIEGVHDANPGNPYNLAFEPGKSYDITYRSDGGQVRKFKGYIFKEDEDYGKAQNWKFTHPTKGNLESFSKSSIIAANENPASTQGAKSLGARGKEPKAKTHTWEIKKQFENDNRKTFESLSYVGNLMKREELPNGWLRLTYEDKPIKNAIRVDVIESIGSAANRFKTGDIVSYDNSLWSVVGRINNDIKIQQQGNPDKTYGVDPRRLTLLPNPQPAAKKEDPYRAAVGVIGGGTVDRIKESKYEFAYGETKAKSDTYYDMVGMFSGGKADRLIAAGITIKKKEIKAEAAYGADNKIFTKEKADKAREILKKKLNGTQLNMGLDPEIISAGIDLAGYHIEAGAKQFVDYARKMIEDIGDAVRPYLKSFYMAARNYPGFDKTGMNTEAELDEIEESVVTLEDKKALISALQKGDRVFYKEEGERGSASGEVYANKGGYVIVRSGGGLTSEVFPDDIIRAERDGELIEVPRETAAEAQLPEEAAPESEPTSPATSGTEAPAPSLSAYGLSVSKGKTNTGKTVWNVSGPETRTWKDYIKRAGGRWYGPRKVWSFYNADPTADLLAVLPPKEQVHPAIKPVDKAQTEDYNKIEGERNHGIHDQPEAKIADDRAGAQGSGPASVPGTEEGGPSAAIPPGTRRSDDGHLRSDLRGAEDQRAATLPEGVSPTPASLNIRTEPGVGRNNGDVAGIQRRGTGARTDHVITPGAIERSGSWIHTASNNLDIIELAKKLNAENRPATPEEQAELARYTGFGASEIANHMFPGWAESGKIQMWRVDSKWKPLVERMVQLLTPEEIATAARSTQYAHYTSAPIIASIYQALEKFGFTGGRVLEPGMGVGSFFGLMPEAMRAQSKYTGIEMDGITAAIAKHLYPLQNIIEGDYTKQRFPNGFFDLGVGNPPFSAIKILADPAYKKLRLSLHDFFFIKTLDKIRPGGLMVFITSRYTMDKKDDRVRKMLNESADLLGAIRLPQTAFKHNAGTEVVTDILFLRKKVPGEQTQGQLWKDVAPVDTPEGEFLINEYFAAHPEMVLGRHSGKGKMYGPQAQYTVLPAEGNIEEAFAAAAANLPKDVYSVAHASPATQEAATIEKDFNPLNQKEGGLYLSPKGAVLVTESGAGVPVTTLSPKLTPKDLRWLTSYIELRDALKKCQYDQLHDGDWEKSLAELNRIYATFKLAHGRIQEFTLSERTTTDEDGNEVQFVVRNYKNAKLLKLDVESPLVEMLEDITEDGKIVNGPFLQGRTIKKPVPAEIKSAPDALAVSLNERGKLDIPHIASLLGQPENDIIEQLGDLIYETPGQGFVTADEYLSGNVVAKLEEARAAAKLDPKYNRNIDALMKAQPVPLAAKDITVNAGSSWLPIRYHNDFIHTVLELPPSARANHSTADNQWTVSGIPPQSQRGRASEWSTPDRGANEIFAAVLNNSTIKVYHTQKVNGQDVTSIDPQATAQVNDVAKRMRARFKSWVWEDAARARDILEIYNATRNNIVPRRFDGRHLTLPGVSLRYQLLPHQKDAIWRVIQDGNTYIAHAVGAGKTYEMVAAGMEMKRLGLISKPLYVVPNHMLKQFAHEFQDLYPMAHIMVADDENFHTTNRRRFMAQAALNNPDAIVITHSAFGLLKMKEENILPVRNEIIDELRVSLEDLQEDKQANRIRIKQMEKRIEQTEQRFDAMIAQGDNVLTFEDMGVDFLFVDEAHQFRKLDFTTNRQAKGIDPVGSVRAMGLYIKTKWLGSQKPGRSHVFASGTPVTNTMGELYTIMKFFSMKEMEQDGIDFFDSWATEYGEMASVPEMNAAGRYEMVDRFARFVNIPELMSRVRMFMDVLTSSQLSAFVARPKIKNGQPTIVVTPASAALKNYQDTVLQPRIEHSKQWKPSPQEPGNPDPLINIITDGRLASIDMRFVQPNAPNDPGSKLNQYLDTIIRLHRETKDAVYLDPTTDKESHVKGAALICFFNHGFGRQIAAHRGFDARAWAMSRFKEAGIPAAEIAWIEDYDTAAKKEAVMKEVRAGTKRILLGSAKKMGTGMNVQTRLANMTYLDPPWYPSDVEQPLGRIIRQGNQNKDVGVYYFSTRGSYDATMWQMVTRKAKFIEDALAGGTMRSLEDISEASLYEMAAALASGDERAIRLAGLNAEVNNLENLRSAHFSSQRGLAQEKDQLQRLLPGQNTRVEYLTAAADQSPSHIRYAPLDAKIGTTSYRDKKEFGEALRNRLVALRTEGKEGRTTIGQFYGMGLVVAQTKLGDTLVAHGDQHETIPGGLVNQLQLRITDKISYEVATGITESSDVQGLVTRLYNRAQSVHSDLAEAQQQLENMNKELKKINSRLGAPFELEQELHEKTAAAAQLRRELEEEGRSHPPAMPTPATSNSGPSAMAALEEEQPQARKLPDVGLKKLVGELVSRVKGITAVEKDGVIWIVTKNGQQVHIEAVESIDPNQIALKLGYSQEASQGRRILGKFVPAKGERPAQITLARNAAGLWTVSHEFYHFLESIGAISSRDQAVLNQKIAYLIGHQPARYGNLQGRSPAERRAEWVGQSLAGTYDPATSTGKILAKIKDVIDRIVNAVGIRTAAGVMRDIRAGKTSDPRPAGVFMLGADELYKEQYSVESSANTQWWVGRDISAEIKALPLKYYEDAPRDPIAAGYVPITRAEADDLYKKKLDIFIAWAQIRGQDTTGIEGLFMKPLSYQFYRYHTYKDRKWRENEEAKALYKKYRERYVSNRRAGNPPATSRRDRAALREEGPEEAPLQKVAEAEAGEQYSIASEAERLLAEKVARPAGGRLRQGVASLGARVSPEARSTLSRLAKHWNEFWRPFSTVPDGDKILARRYQAMGNVARAVRFIDELNQKLSAWPDDVKKDVFWYLNGDIPIESIPEEARDMAKMIQRRTEVIGEMLVDRGILAEGQFEKYRGKYIHYLYAKHVLGDNTPVFLTSTGKLNLTYTKSRNPNMTLQQRKELGLIEDASVAVPVGMGKALTDIAKYDYLESIADNPDWVWQPSMINVPIGAPLKTPVKGRTRRFVKMGIGKLVEEVKIYDKMMAQHPSPEVSEIRDILRDALTRAEEASENMPDDFVQLPNSKNYGALAGAFVRKPIADDLMPIMDISMDRGKLMNTLLSIERQGMAGFKMGKVALNLPTAFRNVISNVIQNNMRGRPLTKIPGDIINACESLKAKDKYYEEAFGMGLFHTNWFVSEINDVLDEFRKVKAGRIDQIMIAIKNVAKYYGKIDDINKLAIFIEQRKAGKPVDDAALTAMKWGMDYSLTSRSIKGLRQTIVPFATYQYKIAPLIAESLKTRPWVLAKFALLYPAAKMLAMALHDLDDDDWEDLEKQLPAYIKKSGSMLILPWKSDKGQWQWVNLEYFFPWGNMLAIFRDAKQMDSGEALRDLGISNPFLSMFYTGLSTREDQPPLHAYFGTPIYNELDPGWMKAAKYMEYMANTWAPSMLTRQGAIGYTGKAIMGTEDRWGRSVSLPQAAGRWFGLNIVSVSPEQSRAQVSVKIQDLHKEMARIEANPSYSEEEKAEYRSRMNEQLAELAEAAPSAVLPIVKAKGKDPVYDALREMAAQGILHSAPPSRSVEIGGIPYKMSMDQYREYLTKSSDIARPRLTALVSSPGWETMSPERKARAVSGIVSNARKGVRQRIKAEMARTRRATQMEAQPSAP